VPGQPVQTPSAGRLYGLSGQKASRLLVTPGSGLRNSALQPALQQAEPDRRKSFAGTAEAQRPHRLQNQVIECLKGPLSITVDSEVDSKTLSSVVSTVPALSPIGTIV